VATYKFTLSSFGGSDGGNWLNDYSDSLPNSASALIILVTAVLLNIGLRETYTACKDTPDHGRRIGRYLQHCFAVDCLLHQLYRAMVVDKHH
jgi:hypothetical protein